MQGQGDPVPTVQWRKLVRALYSQFIDWIMLLFECNDKARFRIHPFICSAFAATKIAWKLRYQRLWWLGLQCRLCINDGNISVLYWSFSKIADIYWPDRWRTSSWVCDRGWCWHLCLPGRTLYTSSLTSIAIMVTAVLMFFNEKFMRNSPFKDILLKKRRRNEEQM